MSYNKKGGFTLVELIVVITIIAILGTIAFVSIQSYTSLARNAIRLDGISKIATVVENKKIGGINLLSFVNTGDEVPTASIGGVTAIVGTDYKAGTVNTSALELKTENFQDPQSEKSFRMGATTKKGGQYEVIATMEESGTEYSQVTGTYEQRDSEILTGTGILGKKTFTLSNPGDINKLNKGDIVSGTGIPVSTAISKVSSDGLTLFLNNTITVTSNAIQLGASETDGMVVGTDGNTPVTQGSTTVAYTSLPPAPIVFLGNSTNSFVTVWQTDNSGISASNQVKLPLDSSGTYNFIVDWGDTTTDTITTYNQSEATHTYSSDGTYTIIIDGILQGFSFGSSGGDPRKLTEVQQWGNIKLASTTGYQFSGIGNVIFSASDTLDTSNVTSMSQIFGGATNFNQDIGDWDTSSVENMSYAFYNASDFNQDIGSWDTTSVNNIYGMFYSASSFNQSLSDWDTSTLVDMRSIFQYANSFNGDLSGWETGNAVYMDSMFASASDFNQDLSSWDLGSVEYTRFMFNYASDFNQPLGDGTFGNLRNMRFMFGNNSSYNQDISGWNVSTVWIMDSLFYNATSFNQDISGWTLSSLSDMYAMFQGATSFNQDISGWTTTTVGIMARMFRDASAFDQDISGWNVSNVSTSSQFDTNTSPSWTTLEKPSF